jgi:hypothetical protein
MAYIGGARGAAAGAIALGIKNGVGVVGVWMYIEDEDGLLDLHTIARKSCAGKRTSLPFTLLV